MKWAGYGVEHNSWEPEANCKSCQDLVEEYYVSVNRRKEPAEMAF